MFIEVVTKNNDKVAINLNHILLIAPSKSGAIIILTDECDYKIAESYDSLLNRIQKLYKG